MVRSAVLALAAIAAVPAIAVANGRPPATTTITTRPGHPDEIYLATTFGLLISHDDGCTFRWVCEQNIGYGGTFDPKYAVARDGTIYATTFDGLRISRDGGCTFETATEKIAPTASGSFAGRWVDAIDLGPSDEVWVGTAESGGMNDIYFSRDGGRSFRAANLRSPTIWWKSVRVAPSRAQRVYVSGYQVARAPILGDLGGERPLGPTSFVFRTDDGGETWTRMPLDGVAFAITPLVLVESVDPSNPDVVFMRSMGANPPVGDRLYRSTDGGATWTEVLVTEEAVRGVLVASDGRVIAPTTAAGVFASSDGGATFAAVADQPQMACVGQQDDGTFLACGSNWDPDFMALARSDDGTTWTKAFRFVELAGPLACPPNTAQREVCEGRVWPGLRDQLGVTGSTCVGPGVPDAAGTFGGGGGCCGAGGEPISGALVVLAWLVVRRRASPDNSPQRRASPSDPRQIEAHARKRSEAPLS